MSAAAPFARFVTDYPALVEVIRERCDQMEIARLELDRITGLPDGYAGKVLSKQPVKRLGISTLGPVLECLGLVICVLENPAQRDRTLARRTAFDATNRRLDNHSNPRKANSAPALEAGPAAEVNAPQPENGQPPSRSHLRVVEPRYKGSRWGSV